jgi:uncharacterized protein (TIGR02453 family)
MAATALTFTGFPPEAWLFYEQLAANNSREFFAANRSVFETCVRDPMVALTADLAPEFGEFKVFRPHRDVRFSSDKSPYKTQLGAVTEGEGGELYYVHLDAEGLYVASGYYQMAPDQLDRFRRAVDGDRTGQELVKRVERLERKYAISGQALATAPRGYPRDHPRIRFLRHKGLTAGTAFGTPDWLSTAAAVSHIRQAWRGVRPLNEWLNAHVGPSTLPPDSLRR